MHEEKIFFEVRRTIKRACKAAEIDSLRFHDIRHMVGTWLMESGIPLQAVGKPLGHSSIRTTERYSHPEESVRKGTEILEIFSQFTDKFTDTEGNKQGK